MQMKDFPELAASRRSTRDFSDREVAPELLDEILADAYCAQWDARLARVDAGLEAIAPDGDFEVWGRYPEELRARSVEIGRALYERLGIDRSDRAARDAWTRRNFEAFGAPVIGLVYVHEGLLPFSAHDAGLMLSHLFLSAAARGLATCALGNLAVWRSPGDSLFDVPEGYRLLTGFALGHATDADVNGFEAARIGVPLVAKRGE